MDLIADAGARDWDVVSGHCDSDGRVCWLGYFDWDLREQHLHDNVAAIEATLSGTKKALVGASPADIVQIRRFLSQLNSSAKVTDQGWAMRPDLRGLQYEHDTVDSQEAATRLLLTLSTVQLVTLAKQSGSAAVALLAEGHDWYGIRPLHR